MKLIKRRILLKGGDNLGKVFDNVPEDVDLCDLTVEIEPECDCCGVLMVYLAYLEEVDSEKVDE